MKLSKYFQKIVEDRPNMSDYQKSELEKFFKHYGTIKAWHYDNLLNFIDYNLDDYINRWESVRSSTKYTLDWFQAMYGTKGIELYQSKNLKSKRNWSHFPEYWLDRGYDENTSLNKAKEILKQSAKKVSKAHSGKRTHSVRCVEYWMKQGFSEDEARQKVSEKQARGLDFFIQAYGEDDGRRRYEEYKHKRAVGISKASKESMVFFQPLIDQCQLLGLKYYAGIEGNHELFLPNPDRIQYDQTNFGFDFAIPDLKIIVEYHGKIFHPKSAECGIWKNPYLPHISSNKQWNLDQFKRTVAESHGYTVITWWFDDNPVECSDRFLNKYLLNP